MVELRRTVRFCVNPGDNPERDSNGFAGIPSMRGLGRYYELDIACVGEPDPLTGYLMNIKDIDRAARSAAVPRIAGACRERAGTDPAVVLRELLAPLNRELDGRLGSIRWRLSPFYSLEINAMADDTVLLRQMFDFSASHRLHVPSLSDQENRERFGKCNSPSGHGHNYRVEPCVEFGVEALRRPSLFDVETIVFESIIKPFDHKHLNEDTREFAYNGGVVPTVENIARVFHGLLSAALTRRFPDARLRAITVWETDRTCCTYPSMGPSPGPGQGR